METAPGAPSRLRLSVLADQIGSPFGGGRFIRGFLTALISDCGILDQFDHVYILATQNESTASLGHLPARVSVVKRRFPSRLRSTILANWIGRTFPAVDVAHGPFFYVFPSQARRTLITFHDASFLDDAYHSPAYNHALLRSIEMQLARCAAIVCISRSVLSQVQEHWPQISDKCCLIYQGVDRVIHPAECSRDGNRQSAFILAVGTVEPRKNYAVMLDAYEKLRFEFGNDAPQLVVVGKEGWMSEAVCVRLKTAARRGWLRWIQTATDAELAGLYQKAAIFTYLSLYEGFGYPPFDAAYADLPMVVSAASSVGEIWSEHACCVDPTDVRAIVNGWKWALNLRGNERQAVVERQKIRAAEFTWKRCVGEYVELYKVLAKK